MEQDLEQSRTACDDDGEVDDEVEWSVTEPAMTRRSTGIACSSCGVVTPMTRHFPKGKYSPLCARCRKSESNRAAYKRGLEQVEKQQKLDGKIRRAALARLQVLVTRTDMQVKRIQKHEHEPTSRIMLSRRLLALAKHSRNLVTLANIRVVMERDMDAGRYLPLAHYLTDPGE
jgi:hypothetical protein